MLRIQKRAISIQRISLVLGDILIFQVSFILASFIRFGLDGGPRYISQRWPISLLIVPIFLIVFYVADLYQIKKDYRRPFESLRVGAATAVSLLISILSFYLLFYGDRSTTLGRGIIALYGLLVFLGIFAWRWLYSHLGMRGVFSKKVILVGDLTDLTKLQSVLDSISSDMHLVSGGLIGLEGTAMGQAPSPPAPPMLGTSDRLLEIVDRESPDILVVALPSERFKPLIHDLIACNQGGIEIRDAVSFSEEYSKKIPLDFIDDLWFLISYINIPKIHIHRIKRLMDISISLLSLVLTLPLSLLIAALIKVESRGDLFFIQERIGKDGKPFRLIKFRSMVQNAEEETGPVWACMHDPRVTRVGRFLRRWRLDEIPQLLNVLKGEMSLVGPRPERMEFLNQLKAEVPYFVERLSVKPGITGWAQIQADYASSVEESQEKLEFDLYYIKNVSFLLDLSILLRTMKVIIGGKGR